MRTIKFRGKRIVNGDWIYGDLFREIALTPTGRKIKFELSGFWAIQTETPDGIKSYSVDPDTIGQFTGLNDKNGKEIYEGDIVSVEAIKSRINKVVEWNDTKACWYCVGETSIDLYAFSNCEVIGNVYDNP